MSDFVVSLTASLVREYLSRKGLKGTLQTLDKEMPRTEESISNRAQLAKEMHIEKLMKKNKELPEPFRTMLEVMVKFIKEQGGLSSSSAGTERSNQRPSSSRESRKEIRSRTTAQPTNNDLIIQVDQEDDRKDYDDLLKRLEKPARNIPLSKPSLLGNELRTKVNKSESPKGRHIPVTTDSGGFIESIAAATPASSSDPMAKLKNKRRLNNTMGGPVISSGLAGKRDPRSRHSTGRLSKSLGAKNIEGLFGDDEESEESTSGAVQTQKLDARDDTHNDSLHNTQDVSFDLMGKDQHQAAEFSPKQSRKSTSNKSSSRNQPVSRPHKARSSDLVFEDVDEDFDQDFGQLSLGPKKIAAVDIQSKPISLEVAMGLKNLIFGTATTSFTPEWRNQSFSFCDLYQLEYGIVQLKGGPCGVLAAVQGFVLKHLLFGSKKGDSKKKLQPSSRERTKALTSAISEILWRAGDNKEATVALPTGGSNFFGAGRYKPDQLTEALVLYTFKSSESLKSFLSQNVTQFESDKSSGCILLLYSVILSRSIQTVISDMDEPSNTLMGAHGYCTQASF